MQLSSSIESVANEYDALVKQVNNSLYSGLMIDIPPLQALCVAGEQAILKLLVELGRKIEEISEQQQSLKREISVLTAANLVRLDERYEN